jgi:hypothetical protein
MYKRLSCPICERGDNQEIVCELNKKNISSFDTLSKIKYQNVLVEIVDSGVHPLIMSCLICDFFYFQNVPTELQLSRMYAKASCLFDFATSLKEIDLNRLLNSILRIVNTKKTLTLLDYGSGSGMLAKIAERKGLLITAYEPSSERNMITGKNSLIYTNSFDALSGQKFDIIVLNQVLEHVSRPLEVLKGLAGFSHKNTLVYIAVPNINKGQIKKNLWLDWPYKNGQTHIMSPFEHLNGFSPKSLEKAINLAGFRPLSFFKYLVFSPRFAIINILYKLGGIGGTTRVLCRIK